MQPDITMCTRARFAFSMLLVLSASCSGNVGAPSTNGSASEGPGSGQPATPGASEPGSPEQPAAGAGADGRPAATMDPTDPLTPSTPSSDSPAGEGPADDGSGLGSDAQAAANACAQLGGALEVGLTKWRRLTRAQLDNTVRDLLGISGTPAAGLSPDASVGPFQNNAFNPATDLIVEQHQEMAAAIAGDAVARMGELSPCDLTTDESSGCATEFVAEFGTRAYRRPLEPEEIAAYVDLFELGRTGLDAQNGFRLVVEAMLQSPFFLYLWDVGQAPTPSNAPVPITAYELATRLSYFLWNTMPDAELFSLAADGSLTRDATLSAQVERMLGDPKAADSIPLFHLQWLKIHDMSHVEKDTALFPQWNESLVSAMQTETATFTDYVVREGDGLLDTLLLADYSFVEGPLAELYGVPGASAQQPTSLPPGERAGLFTQAAFLASHAHREFTSPVHRGITIRENVLCQTIPPPPAGVTTTLPPAADFDSTRERFASHLDDPTCAGCHQLIDPVGLAFEHYGAIGEYRSNDGLGEVDASGEVVGGEGPLAGTFYGVPELAAKLAQSDTVANCVTNQWFRYALGRMESELDACHLQAIREGFAASGKNVRTLIQEIAMSEAFRNVRATAQ